MTLTWSEIVARCPTVWGVRSVFYSQDSTATPTGHRADCSGYVSAVFGLATPGLNTVTLLTYGVVYSISWDALQPGDVLGILGPGTEGDVGHVAVYTGRSGDGYMVWEQSGGQWGPHQSTWGGVYTRTNFAPYRFSGLSGANPPTGGTEMGMHRIRSGAIGDGSIYLAVETISPATGKMPAYGLDGNQNSQTYANIPMYQLPAGISVAASGKYDINPGPWTGGGGTTPPPAPVKLNVTLTGTATPVV